MKHEESITMEEMNQLHDEWWASLSDEDKEKLYNEMVAPALHAGGHRFDSDILHNLHLNI